MRHATKPIRNEVLGHAEHMTVSLVTDERSVVEFGGSPAVGISIHVGRTVRLMCRRGGEHHSGTAVHGDVEIIPPTVPGVWELKGSDTELVVCLGLPLVHQVAEEYGGDLAAFEVRNRFHERDPRIEHIGWALKEEFERGSTSGRVYLDSLANALAATVVRQCSSLAGTTRDLRAPLSASALREVLAFMEDHLGRDLPLQELATVSGLGVSRFKTAFRTATGQSAHQYLIQRRVERAAMLLRTGTLPIGQVALETGFCHQSHMAANMRRLLGVTPSIIRKTVQRSTLSGRRSIEAILSRDGRWSEPGRRRVN
jgi:AraC family transcriptional regulator